MKEALQIWRMDQKLKKAHARKLGRPFDEHVLSGYSRFSTNCKKTQIEDLSQEVEMSSVLLPSGASITYLQPRKSTTFKFLVSIHGGPESFEGTEIRYLGLYRDLLRNGWGIIILNYRGSSQLNVDSRKTWKNWKESILTDFSELLDKLHRKYRKFEIHWCGVSFGGALAMLISKNFDIKRCILLSPLLDLRNQSKRGDRKFSKWFRSRFSQKDYSDLSFENLIGQRKKKTKILALCSHRDEVLGNEMNKKLNSYSKEKKSNLLVIMQNTMHSPKSFLPCYFRYNYALNWLLQESVNCNSD